MTNSFNARGKAMNRETPAVLKRMLISALAAFGVTGTVAFGQDTPPQIPAPEGLSVIAGCISANAPPKGMAAQTPTRDATMSGDNPTVASLFNLAGDCEFSASGKTIDLGALVDSLERRLRRLDPDDDDYQEDLAEVRQDFPGSVFDAVVMEFEAKDKADDILDDLEDEQSDFNNDGTAVGAEKGAGVVYSELGVGEAGDTSSDLTATSTGAEKAAYKGMLGFDVKQTDVEEDDASTEFQDETEVFELDDDIDLRYTRSDGTYTVAVNDKGEVTSLAVTRSAAENDVVIDLSSGATTGVTAPTLALGFMDRDDGDGDGDPATGIELADVQQLGYIKAHLSDTKTLRENLQKVLDLDDKGALKVGSGQSATERSLSGADRRYLAGVVGNLDDEIAAYEDLVEDIEEYTHPLDGGRAFEDQVENYYNGREDLEGLLGRLEKAIADQKTVSESVRTAVRNPAEHLDTLVALAEKEYNDAVERGLEGTALEPYNKLRMAANDARSEYTVPEDGDPASDLLAALIAQKDTGGALIDAVSENHQSTVANATRLDTIEGNMGDDGQVDQNADDIDVLEGQVEENTTAISGIRSDLYGDTASQHDGPACEASGIAHDAACGKERSGQNATDIEALDGRVSANETMLDDHEMRITANANDIDMLEMEDERLEGRIDTNWDAIAVNQMDIDANEAAIMAEETARMEADTMHDTMIAENKMTGMTNATNIGMNKGMIMSNAEAISGLDGRVGANASAIMRNGDMIGELSESLDVVRAGVAASMALAGMPAVNGRGIAIGVGSFDGESAFAVGFQIAGEQASFKVGVTSSGGATGASAGVGFNF